MYLVKGIKALEEYEAKFLEYSGNFTVIQRFFHIFYGNTSLWFLSIDIKAVLIHEKVSVVGKIWKHKSIGRMQSVKQEMKEELLQEMRELQLLNGDSS